MIYEGYVDYFQIIELLNTINILKDIDHFLTSLWCF